MFFNIYFLFDLESSLVISSSTPIAKKDILCILIKRGQWSEIYMEAPLARRYTQQESVEQSKNDRGELVLVFLGQCGTINYDRAETVALKDGLKLFKESFMVDLMLEAHSINATKHAQDGSQTPWRMESAVKEKIYCFNECYFVHIPREWN